jgi:hypothetical protein
MMLEMPFTDDMGTEWPAREYAVETIRSLTVTDDSDKFFMGCTGLLKALAIVAQGGPFAGKLMALLWDSYQGKHASMHVLPS